MDLLSSIARFPPGYSPCDAGEAAPLGKHAERGFSTWLLLPRLGILAAERIAKNVAMPIYERAVRIFLPRPDMQRVERWEPEAIRVNKCGSGYRVDSLDSFKDMDTVLRV